MAVKKGILDNFLKSSSHYRDNQKSLRSIFIDKDEDDLKPEPQNFLARSILDETTSLSTSSQESSTNIISNSSSLMDNQLVINKEPNVSCSSFKDLKTTTTGISDEWNFDILPYARFGFTKTQIQQLANFGVIKLIDKIFNF